MHLVPRRNEFQTPRVDSNTNPEQTARASALLAVLAVWLAKASTADQTLVAKVILRAIENLTSAGPVWPTRERPDPLEPGHRIQRGQGLRAPARQRQLEASLHGPQCMGRNAG